MNSQLRCNRSVHQTKRLFRRRCAKYGSYGQEAILISTMVNELLGSAACEWPGAGPRPPDVLASVLLVAMKLRWQRNGLEEVPIGRSSVADKERCRCLR